MKQWANKLTGALGLPAVLLAGVGMLTLVASGPAWANGQGLGIATTGSPHNFADDVVAGVATPGSEIGGGWNGREEICRVCHVPHDHNRDTKRYENGLLWNHELSVQTYTMYTSATLDGAQDGQPTGIAKLCLGCHDGTVGIDTFDKFTGGAVFMANYDADFQFPGPVTNFSLQGTHPISIEYDEVADTGLKGKGNPMGASGTIADVLEGGKKVQCSTCHDVHDQPGESVAGTHLLRVSTKSPPSGLCLTCHKK